VYDTTANIDELRQQVAKFMQPEELKEFTNKMRDEIMLVEKKPSDREARMDSGR